MLLLLLHAIYGYYILTANNMEVTNSMAVAIAPFKELLVRTSLSGLLSSVLAWQWSFLFLRSLISISTIQKHNEIKKQGFIVTLCAAAAFTCYIRCICGYFGDHIGYSRFVLFLPVLICLGARKRRNHSFKSGIA